MKKIVFAVVAAVLAVVASELTRRAMRRTSGDSPQDETVDLTRANGYEEPRDLVFEAEPAPVA